MSVRNTKRATSWSDEGSKKLVDVKKSKLESHHHEEQLDFLQVCSKNAHEKKSNEIAIRHVAFNTGVSNQGMSLLIYFKLNFIVYILFKHV